MRVLLTTSLLVLAVCSVHCMQDNNQQPSSTGTPGANGNTGTPPKFDKNTAVRNGVGNFFAQLNNDLLYLRDFILANIGEVGQTCGCERSVLAPFLPPYGAGPGGQPGGPGVPPGGPRAPGGPLPPGAVPGAAAAVNNAANLNPRAGTVPKNG